MEKIKLYGSKISYFTGKFEGYLRFKEIPYEFIAMDHKLFNKTIPKHTGASQMPAVQLADGRWLTDTTPMIQWFETQATESSIMPTDPTLAFLCYLFEDYADEWLWRASMHYRWGYPEGRTLVSKMIVDELLAGLPIPFVLKREAIKRRQHEIFVKRDGVNKQTWDHVERGYYYLLECLETIFSKRPFLLGTSPSLADFGLFGPFFRHMAIDPNPAAIMREQAPATYAWVARLWQSRYSQTPNGLLDELPEDWEPLLEEIAQTHLEQLNANALAFQNQQPRFEMTVQGTHYTQLPVSQYRVWCLEQLRERFSQLPEDAKQKTQSILEKAGAWEPLWRVEHLNSHVDQQHQLPFASGVAVFQGQPVAATPKTWIKQFALKNS